MKGRREHVMRRMRLLSGLFLVGGAILGWTSKAMAANPACRAPANGTIASIALSNVTISPGTAVGTLLGSPATATVAFTCSNIIPASSKYVTIQAGNLAARNVTNVIGGGSIMFATNVPGIAVKLTAGPNPADAGNNGPANVPGWELNSRTNTSTSISTTFTAQLIKTGTITPGTVTSINLLQLTNYSYGSTDSAPYYATVVLNPVAVTLSACSVNMASPNFTVPLPTLSSNAFQGTGTVAGTTPFNITYNCPAGWVLSMNMSTASAGSAQGVILSTNISPCTSSSSSANIGVRLLQGNQLPVTFNSPQALGTSPAGTLTVPYYAQYYQTGTPIKTGLVCATATYTMTYQ